MSRIPPRVAVRKNAPIELPHAILLADASEALAALIALLGAGQRVVAVSHHKEQAVPLPVRPRLSPRARVDYIHGAEEAVKLAEEREDAVAFLLPEPDRLELFDAVAQEGVLPLGGLAPSLPPAQSRPYR